MLVSLTTDGGRAVLGPIDIGGVKMFDCRQCIFRVKMSRLDLRIDAWAISKGFSNDHEDQRTSGSGAKFSTNGAGEARGAASHPNPGESRSATTCTPSSGNSPIRWR